MNVDEKRPVWSLIVTVPGSDELTIVLLRNEPVTAEEAVSIGRASIERRGEGVIHAAIPFEDPETAMAAWLSRDETPLSCFWEVKLLSGGTDSLFFAEPVSRLDALETWCATNKSETMVHLDPLPSSG